MNTKELMAASMLIVRLERICSSGALKRKDEMETRQILVDAYRAFGFPSMAERAESNVIDLTDATESLVRREMADG